MQYESNGGVEAFAEFLVSLLDTPRKMQLLSDIRYFKNWLGELIAELHLINTSRLVLHQSSSNVCTFNVPGLFSSPLTWWPSMDLCLLTR